MVYWSDVDFSVYDFSTIPKIKIKNKDRYVANIPIAFDIETTSLFKVNGKWVTYQYGLPKDTYKDIDKLAFVYIWQFGFMYNDNQVIVYGRKIEEFKEFLKMFLQYLKLDIIIYVHNLSYEFQFLLNIFDFDNVFTRKKRKVMRCDMMDGQVVWKCSYILSGMSLEVTANKYTQYQKKVGLLDYTLLHWWDTPLTYQELLYAEYDIKILLDYISYELTLVRNNINNIPMTMTGKVRREINKIFQKNYNYIKKMQQRVPNVQQQKQLMLTYTGATTHANPIYVNRIVDVQCWDIASSYPLTLLLYKYPTTFTKVSCENVDEIDISLFNYMFKANFVNLKSNQVFGYISISKCVDYSNPLVENGKVIKADTLSIYLTDVDYWIIKQVYSWDNMTCNDVQVSCKEYLNDDFRRLILKKYQEKTQLKGIDDELYMKSKQFINSLYGVTVTNLISDNVIFNEGWKSYPLTDDMILDKLEKMKKSRKTLLSYSTGVWCTAYARYRLWIEGIIPLGNDFIYTDTDSIKNRGDYEEHFAIMNCILNDQLQKALPNDLYELTCPVDSYNIKRPIGIWERESNCRFKTLGAKKYITETNEKLSITVAGLNKYKALKNEKLSMETFTDGLFFNEVESGRLSMIYYDEHEPIIIDNHVIDYQYGIVAQPTTYTLGRTNDYVNYVNSLQYEVDIIQEYLKE